MTIEDLRRMIAACAGESDNTPLGENVLDWDFDDLGYDSLARMETAALIAKEYRVQIPDEHITKLRTPRQLLDFVNGVLATI
jgi:act minimal PKS acyl carrier protein